MAEEDKNTEVEAPPKRTGTKKKSNRVKAKMNKISTLKAALGAKIPMGLPVKRRPPPAAPSEPSADPNEDPKDEPKEEKNELDIQERGEMVVEHPDPVEDKPETKEIPVESKVDSAKSDEPKEIDKVQDKAMVVEEVKKEKKEPPKPPSRAIKTMASSKAKTDEGSSSNAPPKKKAKRGKKLKKKGFMLKLDNIFAAGNMPGGGGLAALKKKKAAAEEDKKKEVGDAEDTTSKTPGQDPEQAAAKPEEPKNKGEQELNNIQKKPRAAGKKKKRKKMKFDAKKTAFSAQPVRHYKKTSYTAAQLKLTAAQRIQILTLVKEGKMSPDEAMEAVLKHDEQVREHINEQNDELGEGNKRTFSLEKSDWKGVDLNSLPQEKRMEVLLMVKDGKLTVDEAIAKVMKDVKRIKTKKGRSRSNKPNKAYCTIV